MERNGAAHSNRSPNSDAGSGKRAKLAHLDLRGAVGRERQRVELVPDEHADETAAAEVVACTFRARGLNKQWKQPQCS
jgi:hypothetical protein